MVGWLVSPVVVTLFLFCLLLENKSKEKHAKETEAWLNIC